MTKIVLFILFTLFGTAVLNADNSIEMDIEARCLDTKHKEFILSIYSNKLNLTNDAVQDNIDGYVDIPDDSYYIKTGKKEFKIDGVVEKHNVGEANKLTANIDEVSFLQNHGELKFIQKINLLNGNMRTNILSIHISKDLLEVQEQICQKQISDSKRDYYLKTVSTILLLLAFIYMLKIRFKKN